MTELSYIFDVGDVTVWSPSLAVGALFVEMAELLSQSSGRGNGLARNAEDFCVIEVDIFQAFIVGLLAESGPQHPVRARLMRGFVETALVVLERSGVPMLDVTSDRRLCVHAEALARSMPLL